MTLLLQVTAKNREGHERPLKLEIVAINPGPEYSALVTRDGATVGRRLYADNPTVLRELEGLSDYPACIIEKVKSYGMPVSAEVFETVYWSGRFAQAFGAEKVEGIPRIQVKLHLCHDRRAKDGNIRQALWAALALAVTWWDQNAGRREVSA